MVSIYLSAPLTVLCALLARRWLRARPAHNGLPLPPGPPRRIPWVGNAFDIPTEAQWLTFDHWTKEYGELVYVEAFGTRMVILGSLKACLDLFEKRSANYSNRPYIPMLYDLMGWEWLFSLMHGEPWRKHRRTFHEFYNPTQAVSYRPTQLREARALLLRLLRRPDAFFDHLRHTLASTIMDVTYGIRVKDKDDKYVAKAEQALEKFSHAGQPGAYLINTFPWLKHVPAWFPGAQFKRDAAAWRPYAQDMINWPFQHVKDQLRNGTARPSVVATLLTRAPDEPDPAESERIARNIAGVAYAGGADTTISGLQTFFLAMAMHPAAQARAQAELDGVTGANRLPDFGDVEALPYVAAVCKEVMRWKVIVPLAMVHSSAADDTYNGYFLPAGTLFWGNTWQILHDPEVYEDPESFVPERFLGRDGRIDPAVRDPSVAAFGFGRRICPGKGLAEQSLWSVIASVLAAFEIRPPLDANGEPVKLDPKMSTGLISYPEPFECIIKPRSALAERLIRDYEVEVEAHAE